MNILEIFKIILCFLLFIPLALALCAVLIAGGILMGFMMGIYAITKLYYFFFKGEY